MSKESETNTTIRNAVAEKLAVVGKETVRSAVIQKLVNDEIANRTAAVLEGMNRLAKLKSDHRKIKPDQRSLDVEGNITSETYSPTRFEELKKANEQITKLEKALEIALEDGDYSKLLIKEKGSE